MIYRELGSTGERVSASASIDGMFEPFKTTSIFDGTAKNPAWPGEEPQEL